MNKMLDEKEMIKAMAMGLSEDCERQMAGEYRELKIRYEKLKNMVDTYAADELDFTPPCSLSILQRQLNAMEEYLIILGLRMIFENVDLEKGVEEEDSVVVILKGKRRDDSWDVFGKVSGDKDTILTILVDCVAKTVFQSEEEAGKQKVLKRDLEALLLTIDENKEKYGEGEEE